MTRWLVTGGSGMLARDLQKALEAHEQDVICPGHRELDITDTGSVSRAMRDFQPAIVVNCAAWTGVDSAEVHEADAFTINASGVANIASACLKCGATLVQLSTDYVFGDVHRQFYNEYDPPAPVNAYGRTKLSGEVAALESGVLTYVVRTAWLYGSHGSNFVRTMINRARQGARVDVVNDQHGQPTWTAHVAEQIYRLASSQAPSGIYHATNSGSVTWYGLAREIYSYLGVDRVLVKPILSDAYSSVARRPSSGVLGHNRWHDVGIPAMPNWLTALHEALPQLLRAIKD